MAVRLSATEVEKQLQEGGSCGGTPQMSLKKSAAVQLRRSTNRRGKQAPTPPKRTRYTPPSAPLTRPAPPRRLHRAHRCVCVVACCRRAARSASRSTRPTTSPPPTTRSPRSTVSRHTSHDTRHVPHHYINTCLQANCDIHYTTILRPSQCRPFNNVIRLPSANICEHYTIQI